MTDFKAKMHQIRFRLAGGAYRAPPDSLAAFKGPTSKGRGGMKGEEKARNGNGRGGGRGIGEEMKGREGAPHRCWNPGPQLPCHATIY